MRQTIYMLNVVRKEKGIKQEDQDLRRRSDIVVLLDCLASASECPIESVSPSIRRCYSRASLTVNLTVWEKKFTSDKLSHGSCTSIFYGKNDTCQNQNQHQPDTKLNKRGAGFRKKEGAVHKHFYVLIIWSTLHATTNNDQASDPLESSFRSRPRMIGQ